jgi:hypothetical protein
MYTADTLRLFQYIAVHAFRKRFDIFIVLLALLALVFCPTIVAQERNGWELDSVRGNPNLSQPDAQPFYEVLLKMLDRWNAHDIEGYMGVYWKSPELLVVVDSEHLTAGSNCMILTSTGILIAMRWGSSNPSASKSSC